MKPSAAFLCCLLLAWYRAQAFAAEADRSLRQVGIESRAAGNYDEAYRAWWPGAALGDAEQQELIGVLLLEKPVSAKVFHRKSGDRASIGLRYVYTAALAGRRSAMMRIAQGQRSGSIGLRRDSNAADCWQKAAQAQREVISCVALTRFRRPESRPSCADISAMSAPDTATAALGSSHARLCIANGTYSILVPGGPPSPRDLITEQAYARYGIEWVVTGDVIYDGFEMYRSAFNAAMEQAIVEKHGAAIFERIEMKLPAR